MKPLELEQIISEIVLWQKDLSKLNRAEKKEIKEIKQAIEEWLKQKQNYKSYQIEYNETKNHTVKELQHHIICIEEFLEELKEK